MPLYDDLETRPVRLAAPEQDLSPILKEAFLQGTLGGAVGGGAARGAEAGTAQRLADIEYWDKGPDLGMREFTDPSPEDLARRAIQLEKDKRDLAMRTASRFQDPYEMTYLRDAVKNPFPPTREEYLAPYRKRIEGEKDILKHGRATNWDRAAMIDEFERRPSSPLRRYLDEMGWPVREHLQPVPVEELKTMAETFDRAIPPSRMSRAGSVLKAGARGMFNPVNIAADMLAGGAVGAGSAALGYEAGGGDRESAGLFTPPGEGYEGLVRAEDIERVIAQKELEKEAERQRLLEQYRASGYDIDPNTRLRDLR